MRIKAYVARLLRILPYEGKGNQKYYIDGLKVNGKRKRLFFKDEKTAEEEVKRLTIPGSFVQLFYVTNGKRAWSGAAWANWAMKLVVCQGAGGAQRSVDVPITGAFFDCGASTVEAKIECPISQPLRDLRALRAIIPPPYFLGQVVGGRSASSFSAHGQRH